MHIYIYIYIYLQIAYCSVKSEAIKIGDRKFCIIVQLGLRVKRY